MTPEFGTARGALVTGGARRIGAAIARGLAADGWHVCIHYNRSADEATALAAEITAAGGVATTLAADLADADACLDLFDRLEAENARISVLVNNASEFEWDAAEDFSVEQWDRHQAINLRAPAILMQRFARHVGPDRAGLVVNLLDAKLAAPNPDYFSYTVSKFGLAAVSELMARALAPNVRVNAIAPAVTLVSGPQSRANFARAHVYNPLSRGVSADDIVTTLQYFIKLPTLTGQTVTIDAGQRFFGMPRDVAFMVEES